MYVHMAGVVNYCVPAGEAYQKGLELAREINQKVRNCRTDYVLYLIEESAKLLPSENSQQNSRYFVCLCSLIASIDS